MPLADWDRTAFSGPSRFAYDPERDEMRCPEGKPLTRDTAKDGVAATVSRANPATCNACPVKAECTERSRGRTGRRSFYAAYCERVAAYRQTGADQKARRKRQVWVEPLFAEAKEWPGRRRFRLRGLENVNTEGLLVAAGQNLKRLLAHRGWGRRPWPSGAAGVAAPPRMPAPVALA